MESALYILFYLLAAGLAWLVVRYTSAPGSASRPTEEDRRGLETSHPFLRFSARWNRPVKLLAFITITACFWSAMLGLDWPVPVGLMVPAIAFLVIGISWTYHRDFAKGRR